MTDHGRDMKYEQLPDGFLSVEMAGDGSLAACRPWLDRALRLCQGPAGRLQGQVHDHNRLCLAGRGAHECAPVGRGHQTFRPAATFDLSPEKRAAPDERP